jgi:predicted dehydrogenase
LQRKIGVGVLGYSIGKVHSHAWRSVDEYFYPAPLKPRLVAISGRNGKAVEFESKKYGYDKTYDDWEKVVRDPDVEIVDNCLPVALHPEPMITAAKLGKHLFCEKPLARRAADAKAMLDAAEKAKVKHMVGYNYRFIPAVALAHSMIKEGALGDIFHYRGAYLTTNSGYDSKETEMRWQFEGKMSGYGALADLGTHALDLARFLVGG